jgi:hypothetical protein
MFTKFDITKGHAIVQARRLWFVTAEAWFNPEQLRVIFVEHEMTLDQAFPQVSSVFTF